MIRLAAMAGLLVTLAACRQTGHHADATGMFESTEVVVSAQVAGPLWRLDVEEGDSLMAGQEVALVDTVASACSVTVLRPIGWLRLTSVVMWANR